MSWILELRHFSILELLHDFARQGESAKWVHPFQAVQTQTTITVFVLISLYIYRVNFYINIFNSNTILIPYNTNPNITIYSKFGTSICYDIH
jgi:hypothetical protein